MEFQVGFGRTPPLHVVAHVNYTPFLERGIQLLARNGKCCTCLANRNILISDGNLTMWTFEPDATCAHVSCATPQPMQCTLATASKHACEPEYCIRTSIARTRPTKTGSCPPSRAAPGRAGVRVREPQHPQSSVPMQGGAAELPGPEKGSASPEACP